MTSLEFKLDELRATIGRLPSCAVAFSGGVDSTLVLKVAHEVLGDNVIAVTALSESLPAGELEEARELAQSLGVKHCVIRTFETVDQNYLVNAPNRCYFCKTEMYARISGFACAQGIDALLDGLNVDDLSDRRPGRAAAVEHGVISPLVEANLTKVEVRELSRTFGLPTWDKPALACLSSRIPHGTPITLQSLSQVDRAETFLKSLGVGQVRVRHHGEVARVEVEPRDFSILHKHRSEIATRLAELGFASVEIDPDGYRTGSSSENTTALNGPPLSLLRSRSLPVLAPTENAS